MVNVAKETGLCYRLAMRPEGNWPLWRKDGRIQRAGGLVDPASLDPFDRATCAVVRDVFLKTQKEHEDTYYADRFARLTLMFINSESANALALERARVRGIAVYVGLIRRLWAAFQLGLTLPGFLDGAFDFPPGALPQDSLASLRRGQSLAMLPGDDWPEERVVALSDLFERAITFLVCHELTHHARGHIDLVKQRLGFDGIDELRAVAAAGPESQLLRMIEFDADFGAVDMIMITLDEESKRVGWSRDKSEAQGFQWMVAVATLFLIFDLQHLPIDRQYEASHPAPVHRAILVVGTFSRTFSRLFKWTEEVRKRWEEAAWEAVSEIGEALGLPEGRWHGVHTRLMDLERYEAEEREFMKFETWVGSSNTGGDAPEPEWLAACRPRLDDQSA